MDVSGQVFLSSINMYIVQTRGGGRRGEWEGGGVVLQQTHERLLLEQEAPSGSARRPQAACERRS